MPRSPRLAGVLLAGCCLGLFLTTAAHGARIEAKPGKRYTVSQQNGPWMIMVATFHPSDGAADEGKTPEQAADALVLELRQNGIPAYVFEVNPPPQRITAYDAAGRPVQRKPLRRAKSVGVLAGNCMLPEFGPAVAPEIAPRIMPVGTYIVGTAPLDPSLCERLIPGNAAVCDNNFVLDYFRFSADHRMLFGGRVSYTTMTPPDLKGVMARRMGAVFPELKAAPVEYVWGGFVDISMNRAPDFGRLGDNLYYLQGFSGHGVALTGLAGQMVAEAVAGQAGRFDLFARLKHHAFPGGPLLRTPTLALGMLWHRMKDVIG